MAELKDRYAAALFEMSLESGELEKHLAEAAFILERLEQEQLHAFLSDPHIPNDTKLELIDKHFSGRISGDLMDFLRMTVEKGREAMIAPTLTAYLELGNRHWGKTKAYVVSARALRPEQIDALSALLSKKLRKQTEIIAKEDPSLIGGLYIYADGKLFDRTIKTQLNALKESLRRRGDK